jgi:hypothetical protein
MSGLDTEFKSSEKIHEETWKVRRYGAIEEVIEWDDSVKYLVVVQDVGRPPFVKRKFNSRLSAIHFFENVMKESRID